ncbi:DUF4129 domain-containing protein [Natrinema salsiterrestre]|uniref:DUF4129 domain-containing protein n=1 Tax=Natrinema salsiterrestre TaxID=2950540 RepID=A0A9Q4KXB5_9EURY|nr:DUF4129 domain-containing protein [Natrinema salsiterrestre]MDF9744983.1 DUF4129 domain-containing protein [Natrinema salsiterrestre]
MSDDSTTDDAAGGADYRQVSFVVLAGLALVLAAVFAPGMAGGSDGGSSPGFEFDLDGDPSEVETEPTEPTDDGVDEPGEGFDWRKLLEWLDFRPDDGDGGDRPTEVEEPQCVITLDRKPVPGRDVTATIRYEGEPLVDTPVWFGDRRVGETDRAGRVTGEVPYVEELVVRVGAATDATCRGGTPTARSSSAGVPGAVAPPTDQSGTIAARTAAATAVAIPAPLAASTQDGDSENGTATYAVDGEVELRVDGDPYPGETVTVTAAIEGEPMTEATVSVDGTAVGETDGSGRAAVTVPDDGTDAFELEVARGDFAGTTTVDVLLLEAAFSPDGLAPVPGSPGAVEATIDGEPVEGAEVTVGGEYVGATGADGRLATGLPLDPTTTVTVSTERQTASVSLVGAYGGGVLLVALVVAGLAALAYRRHGRRGPLTVFGAASILVAVLVIEAFYGRTGGLAALGVVALLGLAVVLTRSDREVTRPTTDDLPSVRDRLNRLESRLVALALRVVDRVEALLARGYSLAAAVREWLRSLPRSGRALWKRFAGWLGTLPSRLRSGLEAPGGLPTRAIAAGVGAIPLIAGGYVVDGVRGAILVTVALAVAGVVLFRSDEDATDPTASDDDRMAEESTVFDAGENGSRDDRRSFRELWRAFARRVAPRRWRTRTPGEIERRALSKGYPREPVRELTTLFREVEYGGRPRSSARRERAADAYEAVERARDRGDGESADGTEQEEPATEGQS